MKKGIMILISILMITISPAYAEMHDWSDWETIEEPTCTETGIAQRYCYDCGETQERTVKKVAHDWDEWDIKKNANLISTGKKQRTCYVCDKVETKVIPKKTLTKNQKKAKKTVEKYLKAAKKYQPKKMRKCFAKYTKKYGYPTNYLPKLYKKYNKKMSWKIVDVTGNGKNITFKVDVKHVDYYDPGYRAYEKTILECAYAGKVPSEKVLMKKFMKRYKKYIDPSEKETERITFYMVKKGKGYKIKNNYREVVDIGAGDINIIIKNIEKEYT